MSRADSPGDTAQGGIAQGDPTGSSERRPGGRMVVLALAVVASLGVIAITAALVRPQPPPASSPADDLRGASDSPDATSDERAASAEEVADAELTPDLSFERFDGAVVRLGDWQGQPVVVNFWASWCPPCVAEMRDAFEPVHQEIGDRVAFLGVNLQDTPEAADRVVEQTGVTYDLARDPAGELFVAFGGFGMPTTVFVDEAGRVVGQHTGAISRSELEALVGEHLGG